VLLFVAMQLYFDKLQKHYEVREYVKAYEKTYENFTFALHFNNLKKNFK
jgi:hypothetical protein